MKGISTIIIGSLVLVTAAHAAPLAPADGPAGRPEAVLSRLSGIGTSPASVGAPTLSDAPGLPIVTAAAVGLDRPYRPAQTAIGADAWTQGDGSPIPASPVPEPHSLALLSTIVLPLLGFCRRSRR